MGLVTPRSRTAKEVRTQNAGEDAANMADADDDAAPIDARRVSAADARDPQLHDAAIRVEKDALEPENWRVRLGHHVAAFQHGVDANLTLVRIGFVAATFGSAYAAVRLSGVLGRFNHVDEIPSHVFRQRKTIRVRMVRQSSHDPNVFYVYHTPFWRRVFLQDSLPKNTLTLDKEQPLLAVRAFGVQVDETAEEWIWSNLVSSHQPMNLKLLHRMPAEPGGQEAIATCTMSIRKTPFDRDFGHELVSKGLAEYLPESLHKYDDGSPNAIEPLVKRLQQLEAAQKNAQSMQYGIWKDWTEEKLSDRMISAGKRATNRGFQKLVSKVTGS